MKASTALLPFKIPFTTYWHGIQGRKVLAQYFQSILTERRQKPSSDILGELCLARNEDGAQLSDEDIINHLIFLLMAAHDTTASTLTSLFYELAAHPEWQEKLREESRAFAQSGEMRFERLVELKYLDLAIKETLRLHTPLIMIPRKTTQTLEFGAYTLPPDTALSILIHHHHYEGQIFEQPEQFDPLRFDEARTEHKKCPHAYVPFGGGKHHCIGYSFAEMQIKLVMHQILLRYQWNIAPGYQMVYRHIPIQEPKDGLPVLLSSIG
ncbi:MAG: cytochrome P450 [Microscillaceae bacterium]|nr:cytochrome P450 [Microscillaceae bacterium]